MNSYQEYKYSIHIPLAGTKSNEMDPNPNGVDEPEGKTTAKRAQSLADFLPSLKPSSGSTIVRRKSATERLRESRAMYVKSESALRGDPHTPQLVINTVPAPQQAERKTVKPPIPMPRMRKLQQDCVDSSPQNVGVFSNGHDLTVVDSPKDNHRPSAIISSQYHTPLARINEATAYLVDLNQRVKETNRRNRASFINLDDRDEDEDALSSCPSVSQAYRARLKKSASQNNLAQPLSNCVKSSRGSNDPSSSGTLRKKYTPCKSPESILREQHIKFAKSSPSFVIREIELPIDEQQIKQSSSPLSPKSSQLPPIPPPKPRREEYTNTLTNANLSEHKSLHQKPPLPNRSTRLSRSKSDVSPSSRIVAARRFARGSKNAFPDQDEDGEVNSESRQVPSLHSETGASNRLLFDSNNQWESLQSNHSTSRAATYSGGLGSEDNAGDEARPPSGEEDSSSDETGEMGDQFFPSMESLDSAAGRVRLSYSSADASSSFGSHRPAHFNRNNASSPASPFGNLSSSMHHMHMETKPWDIACSKPSTNNSFELRAGNGCGSLLAHNAKSLLSKSLSCNHLTSTPSIVEKNARVIKWLIQCRKAMQSTTNDTC